MRVSSLAGWVGCLGLGLSASPLMAQAILTLDGTGTRVNYSGTTASTTAWALTPGFQVVESWSALAANGTYAQFPDGSWSLRGQAAGSTFSPPVLGFRAEIGGSLNGTIYHDRSQSGQYTATLRLHRLGVRAGGWIGGNAGYAWNGLEWLTTRRAELGGWTRRGLASLTLTVSPTSIGQDVRYADFEGALQLTPGSLELVGSGGFRQWTGPSAGPNEGWVMGSATYWLGGHIALVASAGTYPMDYAQGLPDGTYGSLGIRIATRRPGLPTPKLGARLLPAGDRRGGAGLETRRSGSNVTLILTAKQARTVELMGDFTQWSPVALTPLPGGRWTVTLPIAPGSHRMNVRFDGGPWGVPPGAPSLVDEFSGVVGLLVIE